jgi:hypothetical protein
MSTLQTIRQRVESVQLLADVTPNFARING